MSIPVEDFLDAYSGSPMSEVGIAELGCLVNDGDIYIASEDYLVARKKFIETLEGRGFIFG